MKCFIPVEVITVLGNLVNNGLEAARSSSVRPARVEIDLLVDGETLLLSVANTGDGVPAGLRDCVFRDGFSTHGEERGLGLNIARRTAEAFDGSVELTHPGGGGGLTVFVARMPGVLRPAVPVSP